MIQYLCRLYVAHSTVKVTTNEYRLYRNGYNFIWINCCAPMPLFPLCRLNQFCLLRFLYFLFFSEKRFFFLCAVFTMRNRFAAKWKYRKISEINFSIKQSEAFEYLCYCLSWCCCCWWCMCAKKDEILCERSLLIRHNGMKSLIRVTFDLLPLRFR